MKTRLFAPLFALAFLVGAAPAAAAETSVEPVTGGFGFYSAIADILSCTYYPTRPWCWN
ncbi:hypothetical protein QVA66_10280 [Staphylococcus chromogenes]|nr:hypothetical protein [Staphylococcus chromogenes]